MIGIEEMPLTDIREVEQIIKLTQAKGPEVVRMINFTVKYIDPTCHICAHCGGQIRFGHNRIINWYERNATLISERKQALLNPVVEHSCITCGESLADKRKKYCSKKCKTIQKEKK